jgi:hypothetical protein
MDLLNNILKLSEMQYRKGFEAGYEAAKNNKFSLQMVKNWRFRGFKSGFNDNTCINGSIFENPKGALVAELKNCKLIELVDLLTAKERKNHIVISEITEVLDGLQITISGISDYSNERIIEIIKNAFKYEKEKD